jgi:hypothetical protein
MAEFGGLRMNFRLLGRYLSVTAEYVTALPRSGFYPLWVWLLFTMLFAMVA